MSGLEQRAAHRQERRRANIDTMRERNGALKLQGLQVDYNSFGIGGDLELWRIRRGRRAECLTKAWADQDEQVARLYEVAERFRMPKRRK